MDVSPKTLREVEFREKMRGYHPEDVDQFLERVAAGIEVLQDRLRQAVERAQRAEQAATEVGGADETLKRTLVLAQRTADMAVQEARDQAARIVAGAEQQAQALIADADLRARQAHEEGLIVARNELARLEKARDQAELEVGALTRWIGEHRDQLVVALQQAISSVEKVDFLSPPPGSRLDPVGYPYSSSPGPTGPPGPLGGGQGPGSPTPPAPGDALGGGSGPYGGASPAGPSGPVSPVGPGGPPQIDLSDQGSDPVVPAGAGAGAGPDGGRSGRPAAEPSRGPGAQAAAEARPAATRDTILADRDDDAYFADLRRAVTGEHPLLPREEDHEPPQQRTDDFYDQDFAEARRFGGRLRRRR